MTAIDIHIPKRITPRVILVYRFAVMVRYEANKTRALSALRHIANIMHPRSPTSRAYRVALITARYSPRIDEDKGLFIERSEYAWEKPVGVAQYNNNVIRGRKRQFSLFEAVKNPLCSFFLSLRSKYGFLPHESCARYILLATSEIPPKGSLGQRWGTWFTALRWCTALARSTLNPTAPECHSREVKYEVGAKGAPKLHGMCRVFSNCRHNTLKMMRQKVLYNLRDKSFSNRCKDHKACVIIKNYSLYK